MRLPMIAAIVEKSYNVIIVGYRGYGPSEGAPSENGLKIDSQAIMNHVFENLNDKIDTTKIILMGRSLGGAVAIYAQGTYTYPIKGLILENTFTSISDLVDKIFPFVSRIKWLLLRNHWESKNIIGKIKCPIYFIMAEKDELIPLSQMQQLIEISRNTGSTGLIKTV